MQTVTKGYKFYHHHLLVPVYLLLCQTTTIKVKITHATDVNKISMPSVQSKRSKLAKKGGESHLGSYHNIRSNLSHDLYNFAH